MEKLTGSLRARASPQNLLLDLAGQLMRAFEIGSIVRLKSGGPPMTVVGHPDHDIGGRIPCSWFASDNKRLTDYFPREALEAAERI